MNSECDDVTVDVIILSVNNFLHSSFIQPRVRQERTSPNSKQGVDVMAGNVKLKCKRTVQRAKGSTGSFPRIPYLQIGCTCSIALCSMGCSKLQDSSVANLNRALEEL